MNLVTITCKHDFLSLILQAKSIQKYVKKCVHWVIVNDMIHRKDKWESLLSPYYDNENHILKLIFQDTDYWKLIHNGWVIQQILKLEAVKYVQNDYLVLDSKNFFVVPTDLTTWKADGCGVLVSEKINSSVYNRWLPTLYFYANQLSMPLLETYYAPETPFFIRKDVAIDAINCLDFAKQFVKSSYVSPGPSEFIYYSYFLQKHGYEFTWNRRHHSLWPGEEDKRIEHWFNESDFQKMEISGIHRLWFKTANYESQIKVYNWLNNLGILEENTKKLFFSLRKLKK